MTCNPGVFSKEFYEEMHRFGELMNRAKLKNLDVSLRPELAFDLDALEREIDAIPDDGWWSEEARRWIGL